MFAEILTNKRKSTNNREQPLCTVITQRTQMRKNYLFYVCFFLSMCPCVQLNNDYSRLFIRLLVPHNTMCGCNMQVQPFACLCVYIAKDFANYCAKLISFSSVQGKLLINLIMFILTEYIIFLHIIILMFQNCAKCKEL